MPTGENGSEIWVNTKLPYGHFDDREFCIAEEAIRVCYKNHSIVMCTMNAPALRMLLVSAKAPTNTDDHPFPERKEWFDNLTAKILKHAEDRLVCMGIDGNSKIGSVASEAKKVMWSREGVQQRCAAAQTPY